MPIPDTSTPDTPPWLALSADGLRVWVSLAHVRQVQFAADTPDGAGAVATLWCGPDLWQIADPAALAALRAWVERHAL